MTDVDPLALGRRSFDRQAWAAAYDELSTADQQDPLEPADLERIASAAYLLGREDESALLWERAHRELLARGETNRAAGCALRLAIELFNRGESARGSGWIARARRLLDYGGEDCAERGFLLLPLAMQRIDEGDCESAYTISGQAAEIGDRFDDADLVALARNCQGRALIRLGRQAEAMALLDEAMVAVMAGEVSAFVAGDVYCSTIEGCHEIFDLRRAQEWTAALSHWCESQPDLVPYRGQCLVHRTQIMLLHGAWPDAVEAAQRACERLSAPPSHPAVGAAYYLRAELHRLGGEFAAAEDAYREASRWGHEPQPGLARLRLAQGQVDAAAAAIRRVTDEAHDLPTQLGILPAQVEILLAANDVPGARLAADELSSAAAGLDAPVLLAAAADAQGTVFLAEDDAKAALAELRRAWTAWHDIDAPYDAARTRVHIGLACRRLGDEDSAQMELDAARWVFQRLNAGPDVVRVEALLRRAAPAPTAGGLTARELDVLRLVATGKTNRAIATDLFLSEKTVARHVSNILTKLDLATRAGATAYAYQHDLV